MRFGSITKLATPSGRADMGGCGSPASSTSRTADLAPGMTVGGIGRALEEPDTLSGGRTPGTGRSDFAAVLLSIDDALGPVEFFAGTLLFVALGKTARVSPLPDPSGGGCGGSPDATR
jgi:hypothetical protein